MAPLTLLELPEYCVECRVLEHEVERVLVEGADGAQGSVVIRVNEGQVFDEQYRHHVCALALIHRDARIAWVRQ